MKKFLTLFLLVFVCAGAFAQEDRHILSVSLNTTTLDWKWYTLFYPHINAQDLIGVRYQYKLSDKFQIQPSFAYKIDNETPLKYEVGLTLNTTPFKALNFLQDGEEHRVYIITGVTYSGMQGKSGFDKKCVGGQFGIGCQSFSKVNRRSGSFSEIGYNTKTKWFINWGISYRFMDRSK